MDQVMSLFSSAWGLEGQGAQLAGAQENFMTPYRQYTRIQAKYALAKTAVARALSPSRGPAGTGLPVAKSLIAAATQKKGKYNRRGRRCLGLSLFPPQEHYYYWTSCPQARVQASSCRWNCHRSLLTNERGRGMDFIKKEL